MKKLIVVVVGLVCVANAGPGSAAPIRWPIEDGGNGHYYEGVHVPGGISWTDARDAAAAVGGYLATSGSAEENEFIFSIAATDSRLWFNTDDTGGPWLGGYQPPDAPEPGGGWRWVTEEPFTYTNWGRALNDLSGIQDYVHFWGSRRNHPDDRWNDYENDSAAYRVPGYVVEYPVETSAIGLFVGVNHWRQLGRTMFGQDDARSVRERFESFRLWGEKAQQLNFDYGESNPGAKGEIFNKLKSAEADLAAGDVFVFYCVTHGLGSKEGGFSAFESLVFSNKAAEEETLLDMELAGWFLGTWGQDGTYLDPAIWNEVNKLFILETCHAEGYWGPGDDLGALSELPRAALLAACSEFGSAEYNDDANRSFFSMVLEDALALADFQGEKFARADRDHNGLTFDELKTFMSDYTGFAHLEGMEMQIWDEGAAPFHWEPGGWASNDFELDLTPIPEPASITLVAMGLLTLVVCRRQKPRTR